MVHLEDARTRDTQHLAGANLKPAAPLRGKPLRLERWIAALLCVALFGLWEWLASNQLISAIFFPAPSAILGKLAQSIGDGSLFVHAAATFRRLLIGFVMGGLPGLAIGLLMGLSPRVRGVLDPYVAALHPLPKISTLPLILILFGVGETSKIVVVAIGTFFPMLINAMVGVREINPFYFEVARNYGASRWTTLRRVVMPGALPLILAGVRISLNIALTLTIAIELITAREGLGELIASAWHTLRVLDMYVSLVTISAIGLMFNLSIEAVSRKFAPWHNERRRT